MNAFPVTSLGSLPGTDFAAALRLVLSEQPELAALPELPARGVGSDMIGRAVALTTGLGFDLQPAGWRLTDRPSAVHRRAQSQWRRDLDDLDEHSQGFVGTIKLAVAGPWTLAASVERPRGDKVLADHGARSELAASLGEGLHQLVTELRVRRPEISWVLQLDEPSLPAVISGAIATASGFSRHRRVDRASAAAGLASVVDPSRDQWVDLAVHSCAPELDLEIVSRAKISTVALDVGLLGPGDHDPLANWLDSGKSVWWGVLPADQLNQVPRPDRLADRFTRWVQTLGFSPADLADRSTLTPSCGLAGWSSAGVSAAFTSLRTAAELLAERRS